MLCNFVEIALRHECSPVNLLHIFRTPFQQNTSEWMLLKLQLQTINRDITRHQESTLLSTEPVFITRFEFNYCKFYSPKLKSGAFLTQELPVLPAEWHLKTI